MRSLAISLLITIFAALLYGAIELAEHAAVNSVPYNQADEIGFVVWAIGNLLYLVPTLFIIWASPANRNLLKHYGDSKSRQLYIFPLLTTMLVALPGINGNTIFTTSARNALLLVTACITGALYQELLFRGVIQSLLLPKGAIYSTVLTSILFGLWHLGRHFHGRSSFEYIAVNVLWTFAWGIGASALRIRTSTLLPLVLLHALHNILDSLVYIETSQSWISMLSFDARWVLFLAPMGLMCMHGIWLLRKPANWAKLSL